MSTESAPQPSSACLSITIPETTYLTIGARQYASERFVRVVVRMQLQPSIDLSPFLDSTRLRHDLDTNALHLGLCGTDALAHIVDIVAQHLTRKANLYCLLPRPTAPATLAGPAALKARLPSIIVQRSSVLFSVCAWPSEDTALLLAEELLVEDMVVLQGWGGAGAEVDEIAEPGTLLVYCEISSVRVLQ